MNSARPISVANAAMSLLRKDPEDVIPPFWVPRDSTECGQTFQDDSTRPQIAPWQSISTNQYLQYLVSALKPGEVLDSQTQATYMDKITKLTKDVSRLERQMSVREDAYVLALIDAEITEPLRNMRGVVMAVAAEKHSDGWELYVYVHKWILAKMRPIAEHFVRLYGAVADVTSTSIEGHIIEGSGEAKCNAPATRLYQVLEPRGV